MAIQNSLRSESKQKFPIHSSQPDLNIKNNRLSLLTNDGKLRARIGLWARDNRLTVYTHDSFLNADVVAADDTEAIIVSENTGPYPVREIIGHIRRKSPSVLIIVAFEDSRLPDWFKEDKVTKAWISPYRVKELSAFLDEISKQPPVKQNSRPPFAKLTQNPQAELQNQKPLNAVTAVKAEPVLTAPAPPATETPAKYPQILTGRSESVRALYQQLCKLASTQTAYMLSGEKGAGFEYCVREIHRMSEEKNSLLFPLVYDTTDIGNSLLLDLNKYIKRSQGKTLTVFIQNSHELTEAECALIKPYVSESQRPGSPLRLIFGVSTDCCDNHASCPIMKFGLANVTIPPLKSRKEDIPYVLRRALFELVSLYPGTRARAIDPDALSYISEQPWAEDLESITRNFHKIFLTCSERVTRLSHVQQQER